MSWGRVQWVLGLSVLWDPVCLSRRWRMQWAQRGWLAVLRSAASAPSSTKHSSGSGSSTTTEKSMLAATSALRYRKAGGGSSGRGGQALGPSGRWWCFDGR